MTPVSEIKKQKVKINKAYLVSCVNSRFDDISEAASILKGKKVAGDVDFYIAAASSEIQTRSEENGDWEILLNAGAKPLPPGCGPCIGLGTGLLEDGEVGISATNRNFKGTNGIIFGSCLSCFAGRCRAISRKRLYRFCVRIGKSGPHQSA